ncbi:hypothetical protein [Cerasicoccus frondis]|uniref:hypothetical protein n=1 Tax=Cerasicoccus frondis TaxID=490090 RepID=UPI0028528E83|nr:hypothetical protein [Cerasicoccus frondis]
MRPRQRRNKSKEKLIVGLACGLPILILFPFVVLMVGLGFIPSMFISMAPVVVIAERLQKKYKLTAQELAGAVSLTVVLVIFAAILFFMLLR